jgi:hypothetical protein
MTPIFQKWSRRLPTKPICNNTADHSARDPSGCSPPETKVSATWRGSLRTRRNTSSMGRSPRWLGLSSNAKQIFARNSSEYVQFDEPETVINAIREVDDQSRRPVAAHRDVKWKRENGDLCGVELLDQ